MIRTALIILLVAIIAVAYYIGGQCDIRPMINHPQQCIEIVKERLP